MFEVHFGVCPSRSKVEEDSENSSLFQWAKISVREILESSSSRHDGAAKDRKRK